VRVHGTFANHRAAQLHTIGVGVELHVVADSDGRHHNADLNCELPSDHRNTIQQIAATALINQLHQAIANLELHGVHVEQLLHRRSLRRLGGRLAPRIVLLFGAIVLRYEFHRPSQSTHQ
jgi:hypothetical protein